MPTQFHLGEEKPAYPIGLKVFTQYILIPLMTLYMAILALYEIKIITQQVLPKGIVVWMVIGYAFFGILSLLLIYPIRKLQENKWIHTFSRIFYIVLIPFLVLLFIAIGIRIKHYGVTQERYSIVSVGIWLTIIIILLLLKPNTLKAIPATLCIFALIATYGPLSAPSISLHSQINQLKSYLQNPKAKTNNPKSILQYLVENFGLTVVQPLTNTDLTKVENTILSKQNNNKYFSRYSYQDQAIDTLTEILKIKNTGNFYPNENLGEYIYINRPNANITNIKGYDYIVDNINYTTEFTIENNKFNITRVENVLTFSQNNVVQWTFSLNDYAKNLKALISQNKIQTDSSGDYKPTDSILQIKKSTSNYDVIFQINRMNFNSDQIYQKDAPYISCDAKLLLKKRDE